MVLYNGGVAEFSNFYLEEQKHQCLEIIQIEVDLTSSLMAPQINNEDLLLLSSGDDLVSNSTGSMPSTEEWRSDVPVLCRILDGLH